MKMRSAEFIVLSACTMMLTALGIDIMLPAFAELREHFGLGRESTAAAQIISFFFLGQISQIVFGALSDSMGRLAILRIGFPLYIIGGVAATFAPGFELMLAARFIAGIGASAVFMTTIASVRDRYVGDDMARIMSLVLTIFLCTPVFAPFLGLGILKIASWRMVFLTPPLFAFIVFLWSLRLEESLPVERRNKFSWQSSRDAIRAIITNRTFLRYITITTLLFTALSSYVSSSERIVGEIYGKPELFVWIFAGIGLLMSACTLINSRLSIRFGARRAMRGLLVAYTLVAAGLLVVTLSSNGLPNMIVFFAAVAAMMALNLAIEPNSSALALEAMGERAGVASAVYGTIFFFVGASLGSLISYLLVDSVVPFVVCCFTFGFIGVVLSFRDKQR